MKTIYTQLGKRVRYFRERKGITQMDLELSTGISSGSLSRIENGTINPHKETVYKIADELDLYFAEKAYLINGSESLKQTEIDNAIENVKSSFEKLYNFSYLLDNRYRIIYFSAGFRLLSKLIRVDYKTLINMSVEEVLFNPELKARDLIPKEEFYDIAISVVKKFILQQVFIDEPWMKELLAKLHTYPDFTKIYTDALNSNIDIYSEDTRAVTLNVLGKDLKMVYNFLPLLSDGRFTIIEYKLINPKIIDYLFKRDGE